MTLQPVPESASKNSLTQAKSLSAHASAALAYASRFSWPVVPCHSVEGINGSSHCTCGKSDCPNPGKHPRTLHGLKDATTDAAQIEAWWCKWPDANIAIVTGQVSGLVVIDIDKSPTKFGEDSLEELQTQLGKLPSTCEQITGSGGRHLLFRYPESLTIRSRTGIAPGIDVRANGGYIIAPPSSHKSGRVYAWELSSRPGDVPLADLPAAWLRTLADYPDTDGAKRYDYAPPDDKTLPSVEQRITRARNYVRSRPGAISGQGGHAQTFATACLVVRGFCVPPDAAMSIMREYSARCDPPWSDKDLAHKISEAAAKSTMEWGCKLSEKKPDATPPVATADGEVIEGPPLRRDAKGLAIVSLANVATFFAHTPEWRDALGSNQFSGRTELRKCPPSHATLPRGEYPREWTDCDDRQATIWLQRDSGVAWRGNPGLDLVRQAVEATADQNPFHPVRDYLDALEWDQVPRITDWLTTYLGAESTPLHRAVGQSWLLSAVARVFMPGVKADHMLILEGAQGLGKSTALEILASRPWFSDELPDLHSKDSALQLLGRWIVEVAELSAFRRAEQESIKAFMSRNTDDFRPPYGMRNKKFPRQTVFVGTTNSDQYMSDDTGARRLWPVRCGKIDLDALKRDRDQIWAEVMTRHHAGAVWWLEDPDIIAAAADAADERYQADTWESLIARHISSLCDQSVTVVGLLTGPLDLELGKCGQREQTRVAGILRRLGWERYQRRTGVHRSWEYRPKGAP